MKVAIFSTKTYDRDFLERANTADRHELVFFEIRLTEDTLRLAEACPGRKFCPGRITGI